MFFRIHIDAAVCDYSGAMGLGWVIVDADNNLIAEQRLPIKKEDRPEVRRHSNMAETLAFIHALYSREIGSEIEIHTDSQFCENVFYSRQKIYGSYVPVVNELRAAIELHVVSLKMAISHVGRNQDAHDLAQLALNEARPCQRGIARNAAVVQKPPEPC